LLDLSNKSEQWHDLHEGGGIMREDRRKFIQASAGAGMLAGLGDLTFLQGMPAVHAADATLDTKNVMLRPEIEPLVRLLEETPRERLLEEVGSRIQAGLSYRELLAALLLAGVKNVEPRPSVGHKFHAVLVVNSAHLASLSSPPEHRWLPIFWALDYYKVAAARDVQERGDWTMSALSDTALPPAHKAGAAFTTAMNKWDESAADVAIARLARSAGANEIYEHFFRYGARDFRSIGHKAIYVANSWRTLQCIGWQHAEPVLRSLAYALLMHEGDNPAQRDDEADRPFRENEKRVQQIRAEWLDGELNSDATLELLQTLRTGSNDDACELVVKQLNAGFSPQSVWDALHVAAGEMLMQQPAIVALHAVTTTNALHFAYRASGNDETRRLMMLQNAAFLPMFREYMHSRGKVNPVTIESLQTGDDAESKATTEAIFAQLSRSPAEAAQLTAAYLRSQGDAREFIDAARVLVFLKGDNAHDYKFSSAVLEDYYQISPAWRDVYLASNVFKLRGAGDRDNTLVKRTRAALA
jgi:hypothetical protein